MSAVCKGRSFDAREPSIRQSHQLFRPSEVLPIAKKSSRGRTRTSDRVVNSHLLYQLSYAGVKSANIVSDFQEPFSGFPTCVFFSNIRSQFTTSSKKSGSREPEMRTHVTRKNCPPFAISY